MSIRAFPTIRIFVAILVVAPALGADGATPIWEPTVIDTPGHYVVTRDITHTDTVLVIASDDVVVDLNGFTLGGTSARNVIDIPAPARSNITIHGGTVRGGTLRTIQVSEVAGLVLHGLDVGGGPDAIFVERASSGIVIRDCRIEASSLAIDLLNVTVGGGCDGCRVVGNIVEGGADGCLHLAGMGLQVRRNSFGNCGGTGVWALGNGHVFDRNTVTLTSTANEGLQLQGENASITENKFQCDLLFGDTTIGIWVRTSDGNLLRGNTVRDCGSAAIFIDESDDNHIEGNVLTRNDYGLFLGAGSSGNVYRGNTAQGNASADLEPGLNNISHGDNYMPGPI